MEIQHDISLKPYNTFGIDAQAKYFATFSSLAGLEALNNNKQNNDLIVLGGGSNILLTKDFDGLVLKNEVRGIYVIDEDSSEVYIQAGAGENWHRFVLHCLENKYAGVENLSLIPGNVGASPMQNIGAYGVELKDVFHQLEAYHLDDKTVVTFSKSDCDFGYRESAFKKKYKGRFVILNVTFKLRKQPSFNISYGAIKEELKRMNVAQLSIQAVSQAVINIRQGKLPNPKIIGNAGSFFKNPTIATQQFETLKKEFPNLVGYTVNSNETKLAAGWLIEQCGWKGHRKGDAGCHAKQALVLVNYGHASGKDIYELSEEILVSVKKKFEVMLEREVSVV